MEETCWCEVCGCRKRTLIHFFTCEHVCSPVRCAAAQVVIFSCHREISWMYSHGRPHHTHISTHQMFHCVRRRSMTWSNVSWQWCADWQKADITVLFAHISTNLSNWLWCSMNAWGGIPLLHAAHRRSWLTRGCVLCSSVLSNSTNASHSNTTMLMC